MRLLTANLREGLADPVALKALLRDRDIDVACFQELGPAQAEAIRDALPCGLLEPGEGATRYHGGGIAARVPLEVRRFPLPGRDAFITDLDPEAWPGLDAPLELLSTHVLVPLGRRSLRIPLLRRQQVRALLDHLDAAPRPRLLVGDLNSTPAMPAYHAFTSRLRDLHLADAGRSGGMPRPTWAPALGGPRLWRLDHALGAGLNGAHVEVVRLEGSDHAGLIVEF